MRWLNRKIFRAFLAMTWHTFRTTALGKRGIAIICLGLTPAIGILIASIARNAAVVSDAHDIYKAAMSYLLLGAFTPFAALFLFSTIIAEDVERGTAPYIFTRALPRPTLFLAQYRANAALLLLIAAISMLAFHLILDLRTTAQFRLKELGAHILAAAFAILSYGSIFGLLAVAFRRPMLIGFIFLACEMVLGSEISAANRLTLTYYVRSIAYRLVSSPDPSLTGAARPADLLPAALTIAVLTLVTLVIAMTLSAFKELRVQRPA